MPSVHVRRLMRGVAVTLSVFVIVALVRTLRRDGPAALDAWRAANVSWSWVALAIACGFAGHAFYVIGWRRLLTDSGISASLWQLIRIFLVSNLGRYLPGGKAWQMSIVGIMAAEHELPAAALAASSLFQGVVGVGVGTLVLFVAGAGAIGISSAWWGSIAAYIAAWSGSFLASLVAVVSPAGLGAREGVMQAVFENAGMKPSDVLVLVVVARLWVTMMDVVPAVAVLVFRRWRTPATVPPRA